MFAFAHRRETLRRALHAALAQRRPQALQALLYSHGAAAFAATLSPCSGRVIADALSTLPAPQRNEVFRHLTRTARRRCAQVGGRAFDVRPSMGFFARLLSFCLPLRGARL